MYVVVYLGNVGYGHADLVGIQGPYNSRKEAEEAEASDDSDLETEVWPVIEP